jgi:hypothetical protein
MHTYDLVSFPFETENFQIELDLWTLVTLNGWAIIIPQ